MKYYYYYYYYYYNLFNKNCITCIKIMCIDYSQSDDIFTFYA